MADIPLPQLFTLAEVLQHLHGKIGRTALLAHLAAVPLWEGSPTHRRLGRKYLFTDGDIARLVESLPASARSSVSRAGGRSMPAFPSGDRAFERAIKLARPIAASRHAR